MITLACKTNSFLLFVLVGSDVAYQLPNTQLHSLLHQLIVSSTFLVFQKITIKIETYLVEIESMMTAAPRTKFENH